MESVAREVAGVLGLKSRRPLSALDLAHRLAEGLDVKSLDRLCAAISPEDSGFATVLIPRATLKRRRLQKVLSPDESELVGRVARVWVMAFDVFGNVELARQFLHEPHALLHGRTPIDVARINSLGSEVVEDILGRLKYGSAA
jgi:putative toxin-antitoxin system antitoxin component (TIGR02293 family)